MIGMSWVWLLMVSGLALFQINFTEIKTTWEVSYMLQTDNGSRMEVVILESPGRTLTHSLARTWVEDQEDGAEVIILAVDKTRNKRIFSPIWRR